MIPGHHRSAADRPPAPPARRFAPKQLHGNGIGIVILLSLLLWALLMLSVIYL